MLLQIDKLQTGEKNPSFFFSEGEEMDSFC